MKFPDEMYSDMYEKAQSLRELMSTTSYDNTRAFHRVSLPTSRNPILPRDTHFIRNLNSDIELIPDTLK